MFYIRKTRFKCVYLRNCVYCEICRNCSKKQKYFFALFCGAQKRSRRKKKPGVWPPLSSLTCLSRSGIEHNKFSNKSVSCSNPPKPCSNFSIKFLRNNVQVQFPYAFFLQLGFPRLLPDFLLDSNLDCYRVMLPDCYRVMPQN